MLSLCAEHSNTTFFFSKFVVLLDVGSINVHGSIFVQQTGYGILVYIPSPTQQQGLTACKQPAAVNVLNFKLVNRNAGTSEGWHYLYLEKD